jgi:hypothetical protein
MTREYTIDVTREGRWWMIHVPKIAGLTQARRISEIEDQARSLIAVSTDQQPSNITVRITSVTVPELGDVAARASEIEDDRIAALQATKAALRAAADYAQALAKAGIAVRDVAELLHVSPQRISQLNSAQ